MSDLLTRLAQRALGVAAPALEPRLPSRYAGASSDDEPAFVEESVEIDAPSSSSLPRRAASPHRIAEAPVAHPPAPSAAGEQGRAADEPHRIHPPAVPPVLPPRSERATEDAHPAIDPPRRTHPVDPAPVRPASAEEGMREVDAFVEAEDDFAPLFPPARARRMDARRVDAGADDPHPPRAVEPSRPAEPGVATEGVRAEDADAGRDAAPRPADSAADDGGLREVVKVVEREADGRSPPRVDIRPIEADEARRADGVPVRAAERGPVAERTGEREDEASARPVVRVSIGRIEVRAAPAAPAPQPAARPGWSPPVMPLADYLKREAGR
ncbi:MAG TPA: hypothetical protein VLK84_00330 [Longimicrobium sp.]|nr:hypothetical protein [Longimicrobium sp.]